MIHLLTCTDETYFRNKMGPWVEYAKRYNPELYQPLVVCLDFLPEEDIQDKTPYLDYVRLNTSDCKAINENRCIQHGEWIEALPELWSDDTYVVIDGDALIQRPFTPEEVTYLENFPQYAIGMNENAGPGDTMGYEAHRIHPKVPLELIRKQWLPDSPIDFRQWPVCCNAGFMVAKGYTWRQYYAQYVQDWPRIGMYFHHIARQQWLINRTAHTPPFRLELLPRTLHAHNHFVGHFPGMSEDADGTVRHEGNVVFARHKWNWHPDPHWLDKL